MATNEYSGPMQTSPGARAYPFRFLILGVLLNRTTGRTWTRQLARGRGDSPDQIIQNLLMQPANQIEQYTQLLLVTIGPAEARSGALLNLNLDVINLQPPRPWVLERIDCPR